MRKGGERRLRHDVGAKAAGVTEADTARALVSNSNLQQISIGLVKSIKARCPSLSNEQVGNIAHALINEAIGSFRGQDIQA